MKMKPITDVMILDADGMLEMTEIKLDTRSENWHQIEEEMSGIQLSDDEKFVRVQGEKGWTYWSRSCYDTLDMELGQALATADGEIQRETGKTTEEIIAAAQEK